MTFSVGKPTKYRCINCLQIYTIKQADHSKYLDKKNSISIQIKEYEQRKELYSLSLIGINENKVLKADKQPKVYTKFYSCFKCKEIIPCIPNNHKNCENLKGFLREHSRHTIALLNKNQLKDYSDKRFREFNYKLQRGC